MLCPHCESMSVEAGQRGIFITMRGARPEQSWQRTVMVGLGAVVMAAVMIGMIVGLMLV